MLVACAVSSLLLLDSMMDAGFAPQIRRNKKIEEEITRSE